MMLHDKKGKEITFEKCAKLLAEDDYKIVGRTEKDGYLISTIWLGTNHGILNNKPLFFETMIFKIDCKNKLVDYRVECYREPYATEPEAIAGHDYAVEHLAELIKGVLNENS